MRARSRRHEVDGEGAALAVGRVRRRVVQRLAVVQHRPAGGEGDHYPWKVLVNQRTGERVVPPSRDLGE